jgi:DNA-binding MarR family transcriptional regulator
MFWRPPYPDWRAAIFGNDEYVSLMQFDTADDAETIRPFTLETIPPGAGDHRLIPLRIDILMFVGEYLLEFEQAAIAEGLTLAQARVLGFSVEPSSMREIAYRFGCDPSNLTAKVDRLIQLGLVERLSDPHDARVRRVAATPLGVETTVRLCARRKWLTETLETLTDDERETVEKAMRLLLRIKRP